MLAKFPFYMCFCRFEVGRPGQLHHFLPFVAFVTFCSKSFLVFCENYSPTHFDVKVRASSRDFDHSSYFIDFRPAFPRLSVIQKFTRVHLTSSEFNRVRSTSNSVIPSKRTEDVNFGEISIFLLSTHSKLLSAASARPRTLSKLSTYNSLKTTLSPLRRLSRFCSLRFCSTPPHQNPTNIIHGFCRQ